MLRVRTNELVVAAIAQATGLTGQAADLPPDRPQTPPLISLPSLSTPPRPRLLAQEHSTASLDRILSSVITTVSFHSPSRDPRSPVPPLNLGARACARPGRPAN